MPSRRCAGEVFDSRGKGRGSAAFYCARFAISLSAIPLIPGQPDSGCLSVKFYPRTKGADVPRNAAKAAIATKTVMIIVAFTPRGPLGIVGAIMTQLES